MTSSENRRVNFQCYCHGDDYCHGDPGWTLGDGADMEDCACDNWQHHLETNCGDWSPLEAAERLARYVVNDATGPADAVLDAFLVRRARYAYATPALIRLLRYAGKSERQIATVVGVHRGTVRRALNKTEPGRTVYPPYNERAVAVIGLWWEQAHGL